MQSLSPQAKKAIKTLMEEMDDNDYIVLTRSEVRNYFDGEELDDLSNALDRGQGGVDDAGYFILVHITK